MKQVEGVAWSNDGTILISCGADGAVYTWDVSSSNRINEVVTKQCPYLGIATLSAGKTYFLTTGDASIKVFQGAQVRCLIKCLRPKIRVSSIDKNS